MPAPGSAEAVDRLASALVLADLTTPAGARDFADTVGAIAAEAQAAADDMLSALAAEIAAVLEALASDTTTVDDATSLISEMISVTMEAGSSAESAGARPDEPSPYASDAAVSAEFAAGAREQLEEAEALLSACVVGEATDVDALFRCFHSLKGIAGFLSLNEMTLVAHEAESALEKVRSGVLDLEGPVAENALKAVDTMRGLLTAAEPPKAPKSADEPAAPARGETVRVDAGRLEDFLDALGELAVAEGEAAEAVRRTGDDAAIRSLERLERITRDMQARATSLRMVSLKSTFRKMSRVARDMVAASGKSVELTVIGADTELDRAVVERIADPLVHLLRNAIDHGIEPSAERLAAGKPPTGHVTLRAHHKGGSVHIDIEDDGRGIDPAVLAAKAEELGLEWDRTRTLDLIFRPGFSTAQVLTEISGRGVGMDAVFTTVTEMRGLVDVRSEPGAGTTFSLRLPLTLAIIDGIVFRAGDERYIVPTHFVDRTTSVCPEDLVSAAGRGNVLVLAEGPVAAFSITETMGGQLDNGNVALLLFDGDETFALLVDEVIGQRSLVIKALAGPPTAAVGVAGAALLGDGRAALVVDPAGIAKAMRGGW